MKDHMRVDCFALFTWFAFARAVLLAGIVTIATGKAHNQCKHLVSWEWSMFKCSDTNLFFQTAIFLILVVRNNKRSSGIDGKISDFLSRNCLHNSYLELRFCL